MKLLNLGCGNRYHPSWVNVDFRSTGPGVMAHDLNKGIPISDDYFDAVYSSHLLEHFPKAYAPRFIQECFRVLKPSGVVRIVVPDLEQIARLYLRLLREALKGDCEAQQRYDWIMLEMLDQMVRNEPGGEMLKYWKQNPMPAEGFVIERIGSEVQTALETLRSPSRSACGAENGEALCGEQELDPKLIGEFRLCGEIHQWMYDRYSLRLLLENAGFKHASVCRADESQIPNFNSYLLDIEADGSVRKPDSLFMEGQK